jgi:hypothetical protein
MTSLTPEWRLPAFAVTTVFVMMFDLGLDMPPGEFLWIWRRPEPVQRTRFAVLIAKPSTAIASLCGVLLDSVPCSSWSRRATPGLHVRRLLYPGAPTAREMQA